MRDLLKRLDRLATAMAPGGSPPRCVVHFIGSNGSGNAERWAPRWASGYAGAERIERNADETPEAFEARALAEIPGFVLMGCGDA